MNTIKYMTGLLTFYLKGEICMEQNFLRIKIPNTILALIPLGSRKENVPVNQISSVSSGFRLAFKSFILGLIEVIAGIALMTQIFFLGFILLLIGASTIITSFKTYLIIDTTAGATYAILFLIFEKSKAEEAEKMINAVINDRLMDTNNRQVTETQTEVLVDAIKSTKND